LFVVVCCLLHVVCCLFFCCMLYVVCCYSGLDRSYLGKCMAVVRDLPQVPNQFSCAWFWDIVCQSQACPITQDGTNKTTRAKTCGEMHAVKVIFYVWEPAEPETIKPALFGNEHVLNWEGTCFVFSSTMGRCTFWLTCFPIQIMDIFSTKWKINQILGI
jgi:hypothetical protein